MSSNSEKFNIHNMVAWAGFTIALVAMGISLAGFGSPEEQRVAGSLQDYDFTTPEKALRSEIQIDLNGDAVARVKLYTMPDHHKLVDKLETIKVHKVYDYHSMKVLALSWEEGGIPKRGHAGFQQNAESKLWYPVEVNIHNVNDESLEDAMREWENKPKRKEESGGLSF